MMLFEPITIKGMTLRNRCVMAPMCMYSALDGAKVSMFHRIHYTTRAFGGLGLIIQEATGVEPRGRITDHDLGIWSDDQIEGLAMLVNDVHAAGCKMAIQIAHAGRKSQTTGAPIVSCGARPFSDKYQTPRALSVAEIHQVVTAFKEAAIRAKKAGYDAIEIHAAHGYLINQFLSPLVNDRLDEYGGTLLKRARFLKEIIAAVRTVWSGPLWVRLSAEEYDAKGHHLEDTLKVIKLIKKDINAVNVSSGGVVPMVPPAYPGYQLEFAAAVKKLGLLTMGGGMILSLADAEKALQDGKADLIYFGRPLLLHPMMLLEGAKTDCPELIPFQYERG
jgi:NADPH2 dehydrogenase